MRTRTEPQRGGHKEEAAQPVGERMQCSVWAPGTLPCLCRASTLYMAGFGARRFLCRRVVVSLSVSGSGALPALCVSGPAPQIRVSPGPHTPSSDPRPRAPSSDPHATHPVRGRPQLRSACHPSGPRASSSDPRATHPARRVPFFQERAPNLTVWGIKRSYSPHIILGLY